MLSSQKEQTERSPPLRGSCGGPGASTGMATSPRVESRQFLNAPVVFLPPPIVLGEEHRVSASGLRTPYLPMDRKRSTHPHRAQAVATSSRSMHIMPLMNTRLVRRSRMRQSSLRVLPGRSGPAYGQRPAPGSPEASFPAPAARTGGQSTQIVEGQRGQVLLEGAGRGAGAKPADCSRSAARGCRRAGAFYGSAGCSVHAGGSASTRLWRCWRIRSP